VRKLEAAASRLKHFRPEFLSTQVPGKEERRGLSSDWREF